MLIPITILLTGSLFVKLSLRPQEGGAGWAWRWGLQPAGGGPLTGAWEQLGLRLSALVTLGGGDIIFMVPDSV